MMQQDATLSSTEIARFDALAADWWRPDGPMAPLHQMNPLRTAWIARQIARHWPAGPGGTLLDLGCGAGLLSEALARRGLSVLGLDAAPAAIMAAERHAAGQNLPLRYRAGRLEELAAEGARFPVVTALELIEHIPAPAPFLECLAEVVAPGGLLILSTLNRTLRSLVTAKIGAEYIARLLPPGTHDWRQFMPPRDLMALAGAAGFRSCAASGLSYDPWRRQWRESRDLSINYIMAFVRAEAPP